MIRKFLCFINCASCHARISFPSPQSQAGRLLFLSSTRAHVILLRRCLLRRGWGAARRTMLGSGRHTCYAVFVRGGAQVDACVQPAPPYAVVLPTMPYHPRPPCAGAVPSLLCPAPHLQNHAMGSPTASFASAPPCQPQLTPYTRSPPRAIIVHHRILEAARVGKSHPRTSTASSYSRPLDRQVPERDFNDARLLSMARCRLFFSVRYSLMQFQIWPGTSFCHVNVSYLT
jgi:hypothetical protein